LRPPTVIGQFHTLFFGSVRMFFLGVLGFAVYGNEALYFSCDPDKRELNLFCYNQFRPMTPQVHSLYMCDASALEKTFNVTKCMVPEHFEKTIFLSAMYTFTVITVVLCVAEIFELLCRRSGYLTSQ
ncbi:Gap junction epsilon-1 protein, partial [Acipenser ruthenus]